MPRARALPALVALAFAAASPPVSADDAVGPPAPRRDRLGPAVDISLGGGTFTGEIADQARNTSLMYRLGAGLSRGPWAVILSGHFYLLGDLSEPRTTDTRLGYLGVGVEPSLRRELTTGPGLRAHVRLGYAWRWLRGDAEVTRLCDVHGGCDGGFWRETPSYTADGPVLAFGVGWRPRTRGDIWPAFGVEVAVGHYDLDRLGQDPDLQDTFVSLAFNLAVGRGP